MIPCALYGRQSDPHKKGLLDTDKDSLSISTQLDHCQRKAKELLCSVEDVYSEQITSEVFEDRPQLRKLLGNLQRYQIIIVYRYDRIVRDPDQLNIFIRACQAKGVRVISCTEPEIGSDPMGKMLGFITGTIAQMEKIRVQERCRDAKQAILDRGLLLGNGKAKYGYQYQDGKRVIDPITSKIVQRIFQEVAGGTTLSQLERKLTRENVPPPRVAWSQVGIGKIIRDPSYYGEPLRWQQTTASDQRSKVNGRRLRRQAEPKLIGEATPVIVDRSLWNQAQTNVAANKKRGGGRKLEVWLRGHVFCAQCGHSMTPHPLHNGKYEYRCNYAAANKTQCAKVGFPIDQVEAKVRRILDHYFEYPDLVKNLVAESLPATVDWQERVNDHQNQVANLKRKLVKLVARLGDSDDPIVNEAIELQMRSLSADIRKEESTLEEARRLAAASRSKEDILADVDAMLSAQGHQEALADLGVKVYLVAGDGEATIVPVLQRSDKLDLLTEARIAIEPDRKGRSRSIILRIFDYFLNDKTSSTRRSLLQEIPVVVLHACA